MNIRNNALAGAMASGLLLAQVALAAPPATPAATYNALLTHAVAGSELPPGHHVTSVTRESLTETMRRFHAVGSLSINLGALEAVQYTVFPTHADALGQYRTETAKDDAQAAGYAAAPASLHAAAQIIDLLFGFGKRTNGVTVVLFVQGAVVGKAFVSSKLTTAKASPFPGLEPETVVVARFAIEHLTSVLVHG